MSKVTEEIQLMLEKKEAQLYNVQREADAWSKGKYKSTSSAVLSKVLVNSLKKEIIELHEKLNKELDI
ncbi:hypothetical protein [Deefgea rivuli]|uniref:hypothetical protein n=1 Tax=Deefgea rivuli TaxID=400948 RepID=UPI000480B80A|nr:hypothetical protein [Deefgea rivuli]